MILCKTVLAIAMSALLFAGNAHAARMVSGVIAASNGPVTISYRAEQGQDIGRIGGIGDPIYLNDEISTGADNSLQILLKDQTVFSIGPNSTLVFDEFIYDPTAADDASLQARVTKGSFKFISGKISKLKPGAMTLKLPNATASIRGTSVAGRVDETGASDIVLLTGAIQMQAVGIAPVDIIQSGWGISVTAGGDFGAPEPFSAEQINGLIDEATLEGEALADGAAGAITNATPQDIQEVEQLLLSSVEAGVTRVGADQLITEILNNQDLLNILAGNGVALEVLQDALNSNVVLDTDLIQFLVGGGTPLWFYYDGSNGPVNPVPANLPQYSNELAIYNEAYAGLVSAAYAGSVNFSATGLALAPSSVTNGDTGSGTAAFDITLDYGTAAVTGSFSTSDIIINGTNYGAVSSADSGTSVGNFAQQQSVAGMMDGLDLLSGASLANGAQVEFVGSFGSITNGEATLDGTLGGFEVNVMRSGESDPSLKGESYQVGTVSP